MTLQDALESQYAERKRARPYLEKPAEKRLNGADSSPFHSTDPNIHLKPLTQPSGVALRQPLNLKNVKGEFVVLVMAGEKCLFSQYCHSMLCVVRFSKWQIRAWAFDCGRFYKSGDYLNLKE